MAFFNDVERHNLVVSALETLSSSNNEGGGCYDYWFKSMEHSLSGRGKMGSLVGASVEVRTAGIDSSLNEYAVSLSSSLLFACLLELTLTSLVE